MADDDATGVDAFLAQDGDLLAAHRALIGVRGDRCTGMLVRTRRRDEDVALVRGDLMRAGRDLDHARFDARGADSFAHLADEDLGHLVYRVAEGAAEFEVR